MCILAMPAFSRVLCIYFYLIAICAVNYFVSNLNLFNVFSFLYFDRLKLLCIWITRVKIVALAFTMRIMLPMISIKTEFQPNYP